MLFKYLLCIIRSYELYYTKLGMLSKCLFLFCWWFTAGSRIRCACCVVLPFQICLITLVPLWVSLVTLQLHFLVFYGVCCCLSVFDFCFVHKITCYVEVFEVMRLVTNELRYILSRVVTYVLMAWVMYCNGGLIQKDVCGSASQYDVQIVSC